MRVEDGGPSSWTPKHGPCPGVREAHYTDHAGASQLSCEGQICAARCANVGPTPINERVQARTRR